jgi:hypothetical protein
MERDGLYRAVAIPREVAMRRRGTVWLAALVLVVVAQSAATEGSSGSAGGVPSPAAMPTTPATAESARQAFARLRELAGSWRGRSTRGWEDTVEVRLIAGGHVVQSTSFEAHPGETMLTTYQLDGDRLLLTHFCVAGNTPRLVATAIEDEGRHVAFSFLDGANLPSRDVGHMDRVVYRIPNANRMISRWTWYQNGQERWLEEITLERVR